MIHSHHYKLFGIDKMTHRTTQNKREHRQKNHRSINQVKKNVSDKIKLRLHPHDMVGLFVSLRVYVHDAHGVGEAGALLPAGNHHHGVSCLDEATHFAEVQAELHAGVNVL